MVAATLAVAILAAGCIPSTAHAVTEGEGEALSPQVRIGLYREGRFVELPLADVEAGADGGEVRLDGGALTVHGKLFQIEHGTARSRGDWANPVLVVTARWRAPDGTRVYADFVGPLRTGKLVLRSEPPLADTKIVALILFGDADVPAEAGTSPPVPTSSARRP